MPFECPNYEGQKFSAHNFQKLRQNAFQILGGIVWGLFRAIKIFFKNFAKMRFNSSVVQ